MKKGKVLLLVMVCAFLILGNTLTAQGSGEEKVVTIRYAHTNAPNDTAGKAARLFADLVKEKSEGTVIVEVYPSAQLGVLDEMIQGVSLGSIGMGHNDFAALSLLHEDLAFFNLPYIYKSPADALRLTGPDSPIVQQMNEELVKKSDVRLLFSFYYGTRQLSLNSPVYSPKDLSGKKVRAIPVKVWIEAVKGMGAIPTGVDFSELPTALATNVVDGQENPLNTIWANKLYEFQDYIMLTGHMIATLPVYINNTTWTALNETQQNSILDAGKEVADWSLQEVTKLESSLINSFEEAGITIIGPEDGLQVEAFREKVLEHNNKNFSNWSKYLDQVKNLQ